MNETLIAIVGIAATLVGTLSGPALLERRKSRESLALRERTLREGPYTDFISALEDLQLTLDERARGRAYSEDSYGATFRLLERSRARIDLLGTDTTRIWSYRCRLTVSGMERALELNNDEGSHYRAKLHEARKYFVGQARIELSNAITIPVSSGSEDSASGHESWLKRTPSDDALAAITVAYAELTAWRSDGLQGPSISG